MTQQMLIVFAIFAERAQHPSAMIVQQSEEAMTVFAFFIFLVYAAFGSMLAVFRDDVIKDAVPSYDPNDQQQQQVPTEESDFNQI